MKERLLEFLRSENKSSAQFAEEIGVQPSGISHILSGRNNPSLDFVMKMVEKYQFLSTDWLLFGKGSMYKDHKTPTLFDIDPGISEETVPRSLKNDKILPDNVLKQSGKEEVVREASAVNDSRTSKVVKIVWFFENNSFEEYYPSR